MTEYVGNEEGGIPASERRALQVVAHLLTRTSDFRVAAAESRQRALRDLGLSPTQIAYLDDKLKAAIIAGREQNAEDQDVAEEADFAASCPLSWRPTILTPVFWGTQQVSVGTRKIPVTIYYPSLDGSTNDAAMLTGCGRYALILFLHGHCTSELNHIHRWTRHLAQLARSGFVVAAPFFAGIQGEGGPTQDALLDQSLEVIEWMHNSWTGASQLYPPPSIGVFGHSYGAMLAGRVAVTADVRAYASLSAGWHEWSSFGTGVPEPLPNVTMPSLHMWGTEGLISDAVTGARWDGIPGTKHRVVLDGGEHWQYLQGQTGGCRPSVQRCGPLGAMGGDLLACFFARYLPPAREHESGARIPISLRPPTVPLTFEQEFFAGAHLSGLKMLPFSDGCRVTSAWETESGATGSVTLQSP